MKSILVHEHPSTFTNEFVWNLTPDELVALEALRIETCLNYYWLPKRLEELR